MLQEEKNNFEERVLAYFDGALDKESEKQLLAEVARNSEKRTLFQSHETLDRLINAARIPLETPIEAKRSIAERIPGLLAFLPGLLGTAETIPILTQSTNPFIALFTKIPFSTAVSIGASVAVLTTAGVVVKNKLDNDAIQSHKSKAAVIQHHTQVTQPQDYATAPFHDVPSSPPSLNSLTSTLKPSNSASLNSASSSGREHEGRMRSAGTSQNIAQSFIRRTNSDRKTPSEATTPKAIAQTPQSEPPTASITTISPAAISAASANVIPPTSVLYPSAIDLDQKTMIRPFVSVWTRMVMLPSVAKQNPSSVPSISTGSQVTSDYRFGLDLLLSEEFSVNVQAGQTSFAQLVRQSGQQHAQNGLPFGGYAYYSQDVLIPSLWTLAGASYTVNPGDPFRIILNAGAGAAWQLNGIAPMGELGLSTELDLNSRFMLRPAVTFDVTRVGNGADQSSLPPVTNGFVYHNEIVNSPALWESAVGFSIGLMLRY